MRQVRHICDGEAPWCGKNGDMKVVWKTGKLWCVNHEGYKVPQSLQLYILEKCGDV